MNKKRALRLAREWAQGHVCSLRDGEATEYHSMFAAMLEESMPNDPLTCEGCACEEYRRDTYPCNCCARNDETISDQYRPPEGEA